MSARNPGLLQNAYPLSKEKIAELEHDVVSYADHSYIYLDTEGQVCILRNREAHINKAMHEMGSLSAIAWDIFTIIWPQASAVSMKKAVWKRNPEAASGYEYLGEFAKQGANSDWTPWHGADEPE